LTHFDSHGQYDPLISDFMYLPPGTYYLPDGNRNRLSEKIDDNSMIARRLITRISVLHRRSFNMDRSDRPIHAPTRHRPASSRTPGSLSRPPARHDGISMLVVDFDETCSIKDTIGLLMSCAVQGRHEANGHTDAGLPSVLTENYVSKHHALMSILLPDLPEEQHVALLGGGSGGVSIDRDSEEPPPNGGPNDSPAGIKDLPGLRMFLSRLSDFDEEMNRWASGQGAVAGLSMQQVEIG